MKNNRFKLLADVTSSLFLALLIIAIPFFLGMAVAISPEGELVDVILLVMSTVFEFILLFSSILTDLIKEGERNGHD